MKFCIEKRLEDWEQRFRNNTSFTDADTEELKTHLLDLMDELKGMGLDDEEAFLVAEKRIGIIDDVEQDYNVTNNSILQMRRSLVIFSGVLLYFFSKTFISCFYKIFLMALLYFGVETHLSVEWIFRFLVGIYFLVSIIFVSIYFLERRTVSFIERLKITPKYIFIVMLCSFLLGIFDAYLLSVTKGMLGLDYGLRSKFLIYIRNFNYLFPSIVGAGLFVVYYKYHKSTKIS